MSFPLQENLEVHTDANGSKIRCTKCFYVYCGADQNWRKVALIRHFPATNASPLMKDFVNRLLLQQLFCPSCGALLDTRTIEKTEIG